MTPANRSSPETAALAPPATRRGAAATVAAALPGPAPTVPATAPAAPEPSHAGKPCPGLAECPERPRLVRRLFAAAEREIEAVEASLGGPSATAARRLGALAATLDRLATLDRKALAVRDNAGEADAAVTAPVDADAWAEALAAELDPGKPGPDRGPRA
ncbi:hypothetical protein [Phreatobacter cathodiphilus]|uniref:Uncharacterized protein n=1 Tax=Phreatobacter cathodiphilus TaxID=1868589 RepID=A0A2S0N7A6_9HYPH|nr:hypothetical protein [Phreatobacter cathodiphilus]AVO44042.1 hypothetical protein C6569_02600 [Phreatobacter cathodiphilus]